MRREKVKKVRGRRRRRWWVKKMKKVKMRDTFSEGDGDLFI